MDNNSELLVCRQKIDKRIYPLILILADNRNLRDALKDYLETNYQLVWAMNVMHALQITKEFNIDLIILGESMHGEDGLTLSRLLKNEERTNHLGIIMFLIHDNVDNQVECYNANIDVLLSFPVEYRVLHAMIRNQIRKKRSFHKIKNYPKSLTLPVYPDKPLTSNETFLHRCIEFIESRLDDLSLDETQLAVFMNVSSSTLYRRLKAFVGMSPIELLRTIRMNHAAKLLTNQFAIVSDIAYSVGYSDPRYFSRAFKAMYGLTPVKYRNTFNNEV